MKNCLIRKSLIQFSINKAIFTDQQLKETPINLITLGKFGVGKTSLIQRIVQNTIVCSQATTIGTELSTKKILINNEPVLLRIWDTAGAEKYQAISKLYYRVADGIFYSFDISSEQSFQEVQQIYEVTTNELKNMNKKVSCILIGCKNDQEDKRAVSKETAVAFANGFGMDYMETSAKINYNCLEAAHHLAKLCFEKIKNKDAGDAVVLIRPKNRQIQQYPCC